MLIRRSWAVKNCEDTGLEDAGSTAILGPCVDASTKLTIKEINK